MQIEKINNRQLFFLLFIMRSSIIISTLPVLNTADAFQDAWAAALLSYLGAGAMVAVIAKLGMQYPQMTVVEYGEKLLGKIPGRAVSLIFLSVFLHSAANETRIFAEVVVSGFMLKTPLAFVIGVMVVGSAFAAYCGIETIGRSADLIFMIFVLMILASLMVPIPVLEIGLSNLEPVLARGAGPVIRGTIVPIAYTVSFFTLTILIPAVNQPQKVLKTSLGALGLSKLMLSLSAAAVIIVMGPVRAARSPFPFFSMVRAVQFSEFFERVEILTIFAWSFGSFIGVAVFLYCGAKGLSQVMGLKSYRPLIGPMAIIWIIFALHMYDDVFQLRTFLQPHIIGPYFFFGIFLFPMGILWLAHFWYMLKGGSSPDA